MRRPVSASQSRAQPFPPKVRICSPSGENTPPSPSSSHKLCPELTSQIRTDRSLLAVISRLPFDENCADTSPFLWPRNAVDFRMLPTSHRNATGSFLAVVTITAPSGENAAVSISIPSKTPINSPNSTLQNSNHLDSMSAPVPSGENIAEVTMLLWPRNVAIDRSATEFQTCAV